MNHKLFCTLGLLCVAGMVTPALSAQNLIKNESFNDTLVFEGVDDVQLAKETGRWIRVSGQFGWKRISSGDQNYMGMTAPFNTPKGSAIKGLVQCISDYKATKGQCSLSFNYFLKSPSESNRDGANCIVSVYGFDRSKPFGVTLHGQISGSSQLTQLATVDLTQFGEKTSWVNHQLDVDLGKGYDYIVIEFSGAAKTGLAGVDEVMFYKNDGSAPEAAAIPSSVAQPQAKTSPAPAISKPAPVVVKPVPTISRPAAPVRAQKPAPKPQAPPPISQNDVIRGANLVRDGDFSRASLAVPPTEGLYSSQLSGRWLRSSLSPWMIEEKGGNLGAYARVAAGGDSQARLLYVACNQKEASGQYRLSFDYVITDPSDTLAVTVFAVDQNLLVGTSAGQFHLDKGVLPGMTALSPSPRWKNGTLSVNLGKGYDYIYVLFVGTGKGYTGVDNVTLSSDSQ